MPIKHDPFSNRNDNESPADIIFCGKSYKIPRGLTVREIMERHPHPSDDKVFAAVVNHRLVSLNSPVKRSGYVELIKYKSRFGAQIFRRHVTMMLYDVFYKRYPDAHIRVGQAICEGYYFEVEGIAVDDTLIANLQEDLDAMAANQLQFTFQRVTVEEARRLFVNKGTPEKRDILNTWPTAFVGIMQVGNFVDFALGPVAPHTGFFYGTRLFRINDDLVMQFPDPCIEDIKRNTAPQPKLYSTLKASRQFGRQLKVGHVGELNSACIDGSIQEVIKIAEGHHEKQIAAIADEIAENHDRRLVLIAGPSSAGKTTFSKRLSIQLKVLGIEPVSISLDNYYVNREHTPKDKDGEYDFEALESIDLGLFNHHLTEVLAGRRVLTPRYNFGTGKRVKKEKWIPISLSDHSVLVIEGIHGLNDALTPAIPADKKYRIYINALNPLAIDEHNRLHTSDTRLIRRIVRDRHYRGYLASDTIATWHSVRRGERLHIFPFQESADTIFDSSLIYEFSVLKIFADRYLLEVKRSDSSFADAFRLRQFLAMFVPLLPGDVPQTSLLREFIGGSSFSY